MNITDQLITTAGFIRYFKSRRSDGADIDQFTCMRRIHIIHYLFYSEIHKSFSIGVRRDNPKKDVTGRLLEWNIVMIPKVIETWDDAIKLLDAVCCERILRVI